MEQIEFGNVQLQRDERIGLCEALFKLEQNVFRRDKLRLNDHQVACEVLVEEDLSYVICVKCANVRAV